MAGGIYYRNRESRAFKVMYREVCKHVIFSPHGVSDSISCVYHTGSLVAHFCSPGTDRSSGKHLMSVSSTFSVLIPNELGFPHLGPES
jgi:hypothetical protein